MKMKKLLRLLREGLVPVSELEESQTRRVEAETGFIAAENAREELLARQRIIEAQAKAATKQLRPLQERNDQLLEMLATQNHELAVLRQLSEAVGQLEQLDSMSDNEMLEAIKKAVQNVPRWRLPCGGTVEQRPAG